MSQPPCGANKIPVIWLVLGALLVIVISTLIIALGPARPAGAPALLPTPTGPATATPLPTATPTSTAAPACGLPQAAFPRPAGDTGRGVHWCPSTRHTAASTARLVAEARGLRLKWAVVVVGLDSWNLQEPYVGEDARLIQALQGAGIMPVVRLAGQVGADDLAALQRQVGALRRLGVRYFLIGNEPNRADENGGRQPDPAAYLRWWLPRAQVVVQAGGLPGLGALDPGGEYGDLAFLRATLLRLQGADCDVLAHTWLATHLYMLGPLNGNYLGATAGFARYAAYDAIARAVLGFSLVQIATEGGISSLRQDWQSDADSVHRIQAAWIANAYRAMRGTPDYFFAFNPWVLANQFCDPAGNPTFERGAFFDRNGAARPVVERVK